VKGPSGAEDGRGDGVLNEVSKEGVNAVSPGTRAIARRSWHSELVGIYPPRDSGPCEAHTHTRLSRN
jgi:hypothetical protein